MRWTEAVNPCLRVECRLGQLERYSSKKRLTFFRFSTSARSLYFGMNYVPERNLTIMSFDIPLDSMSVPEKLMAIETIWDSICKSPQGVPIPDWHKNELENRIKRIESGEAELLDWEDVKTQLNKLGQ